MAEKHTGSRAKSAMSRGKSKSSKSGKKPHSMHIRRAHSGGFVTEHHFKPDEEGITPPSEEHVQPDLDSLLSHVSQNMGDQGAAPAPSPDASAAAAPPAGATPAPTPAGPQPGM